MLTGAVYRYRFYDVACDEYMYSTRYAQMGRTNRISGEPVYPGATVDSKDLTDGWTRKGFDPDNPSYGLLCFREWPISASNRRWLQLLRYRRASALAPLSVPRAILRHPLPPEPLERCCNPALVGSADLSGFDAESFTRNLADGH